MLTNENRIEIYEDTMNKIRDNKNWVCYKEAIIYDGQYDFHIPNTKHDTTIIVGDVDSYEAIKAFNLEEEKHAFLILQMHTFPAVEC